MSKILDIKTISQLQKLHWSDFIDHDLTHKEFDHILWLCDAFWVHSGNPKDPHVELTTGLCSNGYFDALRALHYTNICLLLAAQAGRSIRKHYNGPIDWVVGSDHGAATFSFAVATFLNAQHEFTVKQPDNTQSWKRAVIKKNEIVLQAEDLMSTSYTIKSVRHALREGNPHPVTFAPLIYVLIHRSDITQLEDTPIIYGYHFDIWKTDPKDCALCKAGSQRMRPKQNWSELTQR